MPFADECRSVARFPEQRGQRGVAGRQANAFWRRHIDRFLEAHRETSLITSGNQPRARRRATRGIRISLRELKSVDSQTVDVWCRVVVLAVAAHVRVAKIVRHDEDDVRLHGLRPTFSAKPDPGQGQRARGSRLDKSPTSKRAITMRHWSSVRVVVTDNPQSILAPERLTTSAHFAVSLVTSAANCSGVPPAGS